ncbi:uncharacterized protein PHACADRAFT_252164 [Phanerochaete carnosa HHB-10118-sp]|uniref:Ribophorin II C-terminal domain-containing protein n=1 Tax=Phanerochaete carnosa (strain HHB-10118-sp) TaxID=650164 RepID=K5X5H9_PHACS|nr:uncharacterized protein PHACADRAFT_252164 [Phanerochaete carnosa HHB-10118-sp]EKM58117.1 hypothetical protein PHACADRAFT_252164 [Phanerochaete carnosa HHB-10118-sp]
MKLSLLVLSSLLAARETLAGQLSLQQARFSVLGGDVSPLRQEPISLSPANEPDPVRLGPSDTLKLAFTVVTKEQDSDAEPKGVQPHQTFVRFFDKQSGEEGIVPVRVAQSGKAKFELSMARPPSSLPPTPLQGNETAPLTVSLLMGSFDHSPYSLQLFDLYLPPSQPAPEHPDEKTFHPQPEIQHTFRPEQKLPSKFVSGLAALVVVGGPWVVLLGLLSQVPLSTPHLLSPSILPFTVSLTALEALLFYYWADLKLGQVLAYGAAVGLVTVISGKTALEKRGEWRLQGKK